MAGVITGSTPITIINSSCSGKTGSQSHTWNIATEIDPLLNDGRIPSNARITSVWVSLYSYHTWTSFLGNNANIQVSVYGTNTTATIIGSTRLTNNQNWEFYGSGELVGICNTTYPFSFCKNGGNLVLAYSTANAISRTYYHNLAISISYEIPTYTITTAVTPTGGGTVTGGGTYENEKTATLTATPATGYKFVKWNDGNTSATRTITVTDEVTYTATFEKLTYTLTVTAGEGGTVSGGSTYEHGSAATLVATPNTGYRFVKWSDGNTSSTRTVTVTGNATYTATFEKLKYTVTWKNHDGTTLETDTNVEYGATPSYNGATPTKTSTAQHSYMFSGWSPTVSAVIGNVTYTAQFISTVRKYTVRWYNYDGALLETDTDVPYGTKPTYNGATPTKPSDEYYTYGFAGWSPSTDEAIQGDKDFTAQFGQVDRYYTVRWVNASAVQDTEGALLETDEVKFNTKPDYNGATPKHPKQDTDPALNYDFIGWSAKVTDPAKPDTELETVKGDITYTAIYETTPKLYAITVILFDGQSSTDIYEYGREITIEAPDDVIGYRFVKWSDGDIRQSRPIIVTGEAVYTAEYEILRFNVVWKNDDDNGTILEIDENVPYGEKPEYNSDTPTKNPTAKYTYTFDGWDKELASVTNDIVYTAKYIETINTYLIEGTTDRGGVVTGSGIYEYGTLVTLVATPLPGYSFVKWHNGSTSNIITITVTGEASYLAIFMAQNIYRSTNIFVDPYIGTNPKVAVYKGISKIYEYTT